MTDGNDGGGPLDANDQEIGAEIASDAEALLDALPHYYRGEVSQANSSQDRIDRTTNWAITVLAALLSIVFSAPNMPAYLLLLGVLVLCIFLQYEVRRYRFYDLYRARVRFFQENVFANALEPKGVEHSRWREELSDDLRSPTFKVTSLEALSRRIRRIYGLLFVVIGVAWIAKVTLFTRKPSGRKRRNYPRFPAQSSRLCSGSFISVCSPPRRGPETGGRKARYTARSRETGRSNGRCSSGYARTAFACRGPVGGPCSGSVRSSLRFGTTRHSHTR